MFRKIILLLPLLLFSDEKILDVAIGSKSYGPMLIQENGGGIFFDEEIEYGLCKSDNLSDLGDSYRIKNEKLIVKPKKDCLEKIELSFAKDRDFNFVSSKSFFLNYSGVKTDDDISLTLGSGLFVKDTFFYAQNRFDSKNGSTLQNYYVLKESENRYFKAGKIYTATQSSFVKGYMLDGIQIGINKAVTNNVKTFAYELVVTDRSVIELYNNNRLIQKLTLDAGIYNLRDLPLLYTSNDIKIVITDSYGQKREIQIPFLYSSLVLKENSVDYQFSIGRDEDGGNIFTGYWKRGITKNLTLGWIFDSSNIALQTAYLSKFGKFGFEGDRRGDFAIDYGFTEPRFSFSVFKAFKDEEDLRIALGLNFNKYGNLSLGYHKNRNDFYTLSYSLGFLKQFSFLLNGNKNLSTDDYGLQFQLRWNFGIKNRQGTLSSSYIAAKSSNTETVAFSLPVNKDKEFGVQGSYESVRYDDVYINNYDLNLRGRYKNNFWVNIYKRNDEVSKQFGISGSIGCVYEKSLECALGEMIYPSGSFLIEDENIRRIPSYWTTETKNRFASQKVTLKSGQGYRPDPKVLKTFTGTITLDGKSYAEQTFFLNQKEYFTGVDGSFWIEKFTGETEDFKPEIENAKCSVSIMNIDEGIYEADIKCVTKEEK